MYIIGKAITVTHARSLTLDALLNELLWNTAANVERPRKSAQQTMRVAMVEIADRCKTPLSYNDVDPIIKRLSS